MKKLKKIPILIVDDKPENLDILIAYLDTRGFTISVALNGKEAIEIAIEFMPDIILLDVMMIGINGFETCNQLKKNKKTENIPVIFMTALSETVDKVRGFEVGGVDYITKPFQQEEVLARINAHLTIRQQQSKLEKRNLELLQLNQEKNEFLGIVSHDLKSPLTGILGFAQLLKHYKADFSEVEVNEFVEGVETNVKQMLDLIENLLDVNRLETGKMTFTLKAIDLGVCVFEALYRYRVEAELKKICLHFELPQGQYLVCADERAVKQILDNIISNALKYSFKEKNIYIGLMVMDESIRCQVRDEGQGLTDKDKEQLFQKFTRLSAKPTGGEHSTGLGLSIVKKLVEAMNGRVWAESNGKDQGSTFTVELPSYQQSIIN
jgi:signal transduction histidine kinase